MERPKGYSATITENSTIYGSYRNQQGWADGTRKWKVILRNPSVKTFSFQYHTGPAITDKPTFNDVVGAVITDAAFYEQYPDLEDFAREIGHDPSDREAVSSFNKCKEISEKVNAFFGDDLGTFADLTA